MRTFIIRATDDIEVEDIRYNLSEMLEEDLDNAVTEVTNFTCVDAGKCVCYEGDCPVVMKRF